MMTPKMKESLCGQILSASRQLFLLGRISEVCQEKGTQKQLEFVLELMVSPRQRLLPEGRGS